MNTLKVVSAIVDRKVSGFSTRQDSRDFAKTLRVNPKVAVKADVKCGGSWGFQFEHKDGRGVMSIPRTGNGKTFVSLSKTHVSLAKV